MRATFHHPPGIGATPAPAPFTLHLNITPNYCKRDAVLQREEKDNSDVSVNADEAAKIHQREKEKSKAAP